MDFGKISPAEIAQTDFRLPPDSPFTTATLAIAKKQAGKKQPAVYAGCAKWGRKEWVGKIYPKGTKEAQFLDHYVRQFNSIELNATHYQVYGSATIRKWAAKAAGFDFKFCPKFPRAISHYGRLTEADDLTNAFFEGILAFKEHLGPCFLQLSDRFSPGRWNELKAYLRSLPVDLQFFLELRHPEWFSNKAVADELFSTLQGLNIGAVITDTSGRRDCVHMQLPIPSAFIRFVGNNLHPTDYTRVDKWILRIREWLDKGLQQLYFFMHQPDEQYSPELCLYVIEQLNKHCRLQLKPPQFQSSLF